MNLQIRLRVSEWSKVIELIGDYIQKADRSFSFNHDLSGNNHYHIYLFDIDIQAQSIRKKLSHYLPKQNYAISHQSKGHDITSRIAYQYGTTDKIIAPIHYHGYEEDDLLVFKQQAEDYYNTIYVNHKDKVQADRQIIIDHHHFKPDRVWERLVDQIDKYEGKTQKQIKAMIAAQWINEGKAIPRPSDLHRYAVSIFYRLKYWNKDHEFTVPDYALEGEYS